MIYNWPHHFKVNVTPVEPRRCAVGGDIRKLGSYHKSSWACNGSLASTAPTSPLIIYTLLLEAYDSPTL